MCRYKVDNHRNHRGSRSSCDSCRLCHRHRRLCVHEVLQVRDIFLLLISITRSHSRKNDQQSQWEMPYFGVSQHQNPLVDFQKKNAGLIKSGTPPHMQVLGPVGSKGACLRMREIVTLTRLFFFFLMVNSHRYTSARWTDRRL